jgi:hypothetical protein
MCGISLGKSSRLRVGTGVIRSTDYDTARLLARLHTLSEGSGRRFILGIGTGAGTGRVAIDGLVDLANGVRADYPERQKPPIFFAALRRRYVEARLPVYYSMSDACLAIDRYMRYCEARSA